MMESGKVMSGDTNHESITIGMEVQWYINQFQAFIIEVYHGISINESGTILANHGACQPIDNFGAVKVIRGTSGGPPSCGIDFEQGTYQRLWG